MRQYFSIKEKHPEALLLFRVGDFYETFGEDAIKASKILGIVLTNRNNGGSKLELAGFPHHSLDTYLPKLVRAGLRVAVCDQLEAPSKEKKIVKRGVTELVSPGVAFNEGVLEQKKNNFLASVFVQKQLCGLSLVDVSTGEFNSFQGSLDAVKKLLSGFSPNEIIYADHQKQSLELLYDEKCSSFSLGDWVYKLEFAKNKILEHFETANLKSFLLEDKPLATISAGAIFHYLEESKYQKLQHIQKIALINQQAYMWLDPFTIRNLELLYSPHQSATTLIDVIDCTLSPMGGRLLKNWIMLPLKALKHIHQRLDLVASFIAQDSVLQDIRSQIETLSDIERLVGKTAVLKIHPKELLSLKESLEACLHIFEHLKNITPLSLIPPNTKPIQTCIEHIQRVIDPEAPALLSKGGVIKKGVDKELDALRTIAFDSKDYLVEMQEKEAEKTGISSLKIGFNNVFGYYLEVRHTHKDKVPENWIRKQTLTSAERYVTEELKIYEEKIIGAETKIQDIETRLYTELLEALLPFISQMQTLAKYIAKIDCLTSFAHLSIKENYTKPVLNDSLNLSITDGWHPVIKAQLPLDQPYIANSVSLENTVNQILMITGPNMAGKSALLRQTALIVLMAQMGCFVPAKHAEIGWIDKIFTRVGASDNISSGESTFMVEMSETATILNNISERSLILLDEIGRGTSTYDGVSIAWGITEFLHQSKEKPKTLFATHYHELNQMEQLYGGIQNFHVSVKENQGKILFLRTLKKGGTQHSFGINVAKLAGIPKAVLQSAKSKLSELENTRQTSSKPSFNRSSASKKNTQKEVLAAHSESTEEMQLSFFSLDDPILQNIRTQIQDLDVDHLTPVEALMKLHEIKKICGV